MMINDLFSLVCPEWHSTFKKKKSNKRKVQIKEGNKRNFKLGTKKVKVSHKTDDNKKEKLKKRENRKLKKRLKK